MSIVRRKSSVRESRFIALDEWLHLAATNPALTPTEDEHAANLDCSSCPLVFDPVEGVLRHDDPQRGVIDLLLTLGDDLKATVVGYDGEVYRSPSDWFFPEHPELPAFLPARPMQSSIGSRWCRYRDSRLRCRSATV